jgi:phenylpyruvate tautomerase PptA (4-oxalocrotonate tautomerase family)
MPLSRTDIVQGKSAEYRRAIGGVVYEAMVDVLKAPKDARFQVIAEYPADALIADDNYLGIRRTQDCVFIQLVLNIGRTVEQEKDFYKAAAHALHTRLRLRPEDVFINLIEVQKENWSFGHGSPNARTEVDPLQCDLNR